MGYAADRAMSDAYIPAICRLVGPYLLEPAPFELDAHEATDLVVLMARDMRIAARVRSPEMLSRFPFDVTIRSGRDSGAKTELAKVLDGWGDWLFYGFTGGPDYSFRAWRLVSLDVFRREWRPGRFREQSNGDGTHFVPVDVRRMPADFVIAKWCHPNHLPRRER